MAEVHADDMPEETSIQQMRERINALNAENQSLKELNTGLAATNRSLQARDHFRAVGANPKLADLFVKAYDGEITTETVKNFVDEYALASQPASAGSGVEESMPRSPNLTQFGQSAAIPGSPAVPGGQTQEKISIEEWRELKQTDPVQADLVARTGGVELRKDNPYAAELAQQAARQF